MSAVIANLSDPQPDPRSDHHDHMWTIMRADSSTILLPYRCMQVTKRVLSVNFCRDWANSGNMIKLKSVQRVGAHGRGPNRSDFPVTAVTGANPSSSPHLAKITEYMSRRVMIISVRRRKTGAHLQFPLASIRTLHVLLTAKSLIVLSSLCPILHSASTVFVNVVLSKMIGVTSPINSVKALPPCKAATSSDVRSLQLRHTPRIA